MLDLLFRAAFAALLVAFLIPLLASLPLRAEFESSENIVLTRRRRKRRVGGTDPPKEWTANEFAFERAIEAYEELIDRTVGRLP